MQPAQPHVLCFMSKSLTGLRLTELIREGVIDPNALIARYVPELTTGAWADATVQQCGLSAPGARQVDALALQSVRGR